MEFLAKFGNDYINDMYENEYLRFTPLMEFKNNSKNNKRRDKRELNTQNLVLDSFNLIINNSQIDLKNISKDFYAQKNEYIPDKRIKCLSLAILKFNSNNNSIIVNNDQLEFGNQMILITDLITFLKILDISIENKNLEYSRRKVDYYDEKTYNGDLTLFQKSIKYQNEVEYRILLFSPINSYIDIYIPGLKKVSTIVKFY